VDNFVEFGVEDEAGGLTLVFSVKVYAGDYSESYDGWPANPNPGAGTLNRGSDHTFSIWRNPNGNDANRVEMHRDGMYFGFYFHDRIPGAAVIAGAEGFSRCDDMQAHAWSLKAKTSPDAAWTDWTAVRVSEEYGPTKWWYNDRRQSPPEWWVNHCSVANCSDT
jgi:hypothetical protein